MTIYKRYCLFMKVWLNPKRRFYFIEVVIVVEVILQVQ